jgi:hypothetical protein
VKAGTRIGLSPFPDWGQNTAKQLILKGHYWSMAFSFFWICRSFALLVDEPTKAGLPSAPFPGLKHIAKGQAKIVLLGTMQVAFQRYL